MSKLIDDNEHRKVLERIIRDVDEIDTDFFRYDTNDNMNEILAVKYARLQLQNISNLTKDLLEEEL